MSVYAENRDPFGGQLRLKEGFQRLMIRITIVVISCLGGYVFPNVFWPFLVILTALVLLTIIVGDVCSGDRMQIFAVILLPPFIAVLGWLLGWFLVTYTIHVDWSMIGNAVKVQL